VRPRLSRATYRYEHEGLVSRSRLEIAQIAIEGVLPDMDLKKGSGTSDPYLKCVVLGEETDWLAKSHVKAKWNAKAGKRLEWATPIIVQVPSAAVSADLSLKPLRVRILVWDKDKCKDDDFIGRVELRLDAVSGVVVAKPLLLGALASKLQAAEAVAPTLSFRYKIEDLGLGSGMGSPGAGTETGRKELLEM